jgi:iron complex outermembrane recepter protein
MSFVSLTPHRFRKESARTVELVSRTQRLDRTITANNNLFFTRLENAQIGGIGPGGPNDGIDLNIAKARSRGAEFDVSWQPDARTKLQFALGALDTKIVDFGSAGNDANNGNEFGLAPRVTANIAASFEVSPKLTVGGDIAYRGKRLTDYNNLPEDRLPSDVVANVLAQFRSGPARCVMELS